MTEDHPRHRNPEAGRGRGSAIQTCCREVSHSQCQCGGACGPAFLCGSCQIPHRIPDEDHQFPRRSQQAAHQQPCYCSGMNDCTVTSRCPLTYLFQHKQTRILQSLTSTLYKQYINKHAVLPRMDLLLHHIAKYYLLPRICTALV